MIRRHVATTYGKLIIILIDREAHSAAFSLLAMMVVCVLYYERIYRLEESNARSLKKRKKAARLS